MQGSPSSSTHFTVRSSTQIFTFLVLNIFADFADLFLGKSADILHLRDEHGVGDLVVDVGDEDLAVVCRLDPDLGDVAVVEPLLGVRGVGAGHAQLVGRHPPSLPRLLSENITSPSAAVIYPLLLPLLKQNFVDPERLKVGVSHDLDEVTLELRRAPVDGDAAAGQAAVAELQGAEVGPVGVAEHAALHHPRAVICTSTVLDTRPGTQQVCCILCFVSVVILEKIMSFIQTRCKIANKYRQGRSSDECRALVDRG